MKAVQYEVFIINLDPTIGRKIQKTRPCVVVSPDEMNRHLQTVVILPVTSQSKPYPTRVKVMLDGKENWAAIDQIRTIDISRLVKSIGFLNKNEIAGIKSVIKETFVD
jgi:mRNA interferase MazF